MLSESARGQVRRATSGGGSAAPIRLGSDRGRGAHAVAPNRRVSCRRRPRGGGSRRGVCGVTVPAIVSPNSRRRTAVEATSRCGCRRRSPGSRSGGSGRWGTATGAVWGRGADRVVVATTVSLLELVLVARLMLLLLLLRRLAVRRMLLLKASGVTLLRMR